MPWQLSHLMLSEGKYKLGDQRRDFREQGLGFESVTRNEEGSVNQGLLLQIKHYVEMLGMKVAFCIFNECVTG